MCTVNSTYVAIPAIRPFRPPFLPFDHSHHLTFYFPQRLSAFRHSFPIFLTSFPIFLNGFPIFLNGFPFSKKSEKIYLRPVLGKRTCSTHHGRLRVRQQRGGGEQRGNGVCSAVLATAARWQRQQRGSGTATAGSAKAASGERGRRRQRIGGGGGGSSAAAGSGAAGGGRAVAAAAAWQRHRQRGGGVGSAVAALAEAARQ